MAKYFSFGNILLVTLMAFLPGCAEEPEIRITEQYNFGFLNSQDQKVFSGESIDVSFWFSALVNEGIPVDQVKVVFETVSGGGTLSVTNVRISSNESAETTWTLGDESFRQVLKASVYDLSGRLRSSGELAAFGFRHDSWDAISASPETQMMDMAADAVNGVTFMTTSNKLYRQGSRYYIWEEVKNPLFDYPDRPRTIEIDRNGVLYVSTWGGNIIRSLDHGNTWQACTKPWSDRSHYLQICVSNDNRLWVSTDGEFVRYSDDRGITWSDAGAGMSEYRVGDIFRLSDGTLFKHGLDCCSLAKSFDDGQTWITIPTPGYSQKLYVTDRDEILICCDQGQSEIIYISTNGGATFTNVCAVAPAFGTSMQNTFIRWGNDYFVTIPGYGIMKSSNLRTYEDFWLNQDIDNLFIDHNGVMIATHWEGKQVWYRSAPGLK